MLAIMEEIRGLEWMQASGDRPVTVVAGSAPGESGVSIRHVRFQGEMHLKGTPQQHFVCFQVGPRFRIACRMENRTLRHEPQSGALAIIPAGIDCSADAEEDVEAVIVAIDPNRFNLATAEDAAIETQLVERLVGYDGELLRLAHGLILESAGGYSNGGLFWSDVAGAFVDGLTARHSSRPGNPTPRGSLSNELLKRLKDYIHAHLDQPIDVAELADVAGRSQFHFSRIFSRTVGMTPHRYVVHLRLQRALELMRGGRCSLAEVAVRTGFADQSHLWRWVRRVHGVSLRQLVDALRSEQQDSS
jgi:AraC family transcriptional regulator